METKTIQEWFNELEEPYRTQANYNTKEVNLTVNRNSLSQAVLGAFDWKATPEGDTYWFGLYETILNIEE